MPNYSSDRELSDAHLISKDVRVAVAVCACLARPDILAAIMAYGYVTELYSLRLARRDPSGIAERDLLLARSHRLRSSLRESLLSVEECALPQSAEFVDSVVSELLRMSYRVVCE